MLNSTIKPTLAIKRHHPDRLSTIRKHMRWRLMSPSLRLPLKVTCQSGLTSGRWLLGLVACAGLTRSPAEVTKCDTGMMWSWVSLV
jgi:hypothetical protein